MADRTDDISFDPKTWVGTADAPTPTLPVVVQPAATTSASRTALAAALSVLLLLGAAAAAYLTRTPGLAPTAALR